MKILHRTACYLVAFITFLILQMEIGYCSPLPFPTSNELKNDRTSSNLIDFSSAPSQLAVNTSDKAKPSESNSSSTIKLDTHGDYGAFAAFGEIGYKNYRGSGTYGVYFTPQQRFKVTGEWLTQKLKYHFKTGHHSKWVSQYAIGGEYQYLLCNSVFKSIELGSAYVHAFDYKLGKKQIDRFHSLSRRIAGSDGALSFLGTTLRLWKSALLSASANYDWVSYHRKYKSDRLANGFGGSLGFVQQFAKDFSLSLGAQFREPFNSYLGSLNWNRIFSRWGIDLGIFGNITDGKEGVPDIKTIGLQLGISFGGKGSKCLRCKTTNSDPSYDSRAFCNVSQWVSTPAVYVPVVLSIADSKTKRTCQPPTSTTIPDYIWQWLLGEQYVVASYFQSTLPLTFTATNLPDGLSIDPVTGAIGGIPNECVVNNVTVTATSSCGSTSQQFVLDTLTNCD